MIRLAIRRPIAVSMAYLAVALLGVAAWIDIPIELLPDTELPRLTVTASWRGASPEATEAFLTSPLEAAIQQVRGVERVTSVSEERNGTGNAAIEVEFARGTDMDFVRLELSERLAALEEELPEGAGRPTVESYIPEEFQEQNRPFLRYTVTGPYTVEALRQHVDEVIAPELRQVDGVADVAGQGGRERLLEIEVDEKKALALGLDPETVRERIRELEYVREAGVVREGGTERTVAIRQSVHSPEEVRRLPLLSDGGRMVRLQDVATVSDTYEEPFSYYRIDGFPAVSFVVLREIGTNAVDVADRVKERLEELKSLHPRGTRLILDDDESEAIRAQLTDLRGRALSGGVIVFMVLLFFLRSFRSAAIVFSSIAFSVLITLNFIYFGGLTLNVLTLMGLAMGFGLVIDNSVVVLENVYRRRKLGDSAEVAAERGAREMVLPVLAATLTTVIVFVPFVYLQGELRLFYIPLAVVVGLTNLASLLVTFSFIPALAGRLLRVERPRREASPSSAAPPREERPPFYVRLYAAMIRGSLQRPWWVVAASLVALGGSGYLFERYVTRGTIWRPWWEQESYININLNLPRGEELARTDELTRFFEERLRQLPEVERFTTTVRPQAARVVVDFPDSLESTGIPVAIKEQLESYSHLFGGAEVRVYGYGPSFYGGGSTPPNYSIQVLGYNYETVRRIAEDLGGRLQRFSRIQDVDTNSSGSWFARDRATEIVLRIDRRRLGLHALSVREVVNRVAAAVGGQSRKDVLRLDGEELGFAIRTGDPERMDLLALQELLIPAPSGEAVRLGDVATLQEREVLSRILREDQQYQRTVSYEFRGPTKLGDRVQAAVVRATRLPAGYQVIGKEEWKWSDEEQEQIYGVLAVSLLLVFMVTAALFESIRLPLCVLLTVPMALIGVFLTFFFTDAGFTREAFIGVIMMGGVVVNNAMLLVDHVNQLRRGEGMALEPAILRGALERVRPILMTSAVTILGLLPLVVLSESADANIWNALGYALLGGLASSTVLVLTVTPALYLLFERGPEQKRLAATVVTTAGAADPGASPAVAGARLTLPPGT
ncbi:MAG TPA: efflux RND transporter permease subunit [Longimicrobiaceae bacterium]|nr:efflux RND transporter permease subunit [Longimicrobiaceae bacterium]